MTNASSAVHQRLLRINHGFRTGIWWTHRSGGMLIGGDDVSGAQLSDALRPKAPLLANNTLLGRRGVTTNKLLTSCPDLPPTTKNHDVELVLH
jgi:hypothetical protein